MNLYIPMPRQRYIGWVYKGGSASIRFATQWDRCRPKAPQWEVYHAIQEGATCAFWLRHPLKRMRSAWRWWGQQRNFPQPAYGPGCPWERFVDLVLQDRQETRDPHWNPQVPTHTYQGTFVPTHVYPFEAITATWRDWCSKPLPERNHTGGGGESFPTYRRDEIEAYYAEDLVLWDQISS